MPNLDETTKLIIGLGAALTVLAGWWRWLRPAVRKGKRDAAAIRDAILGREPVVDSITGRQLAPALPGIGQRMATQETQMAEITSAVAQIAATHLQLTRMDRTLDEHEDRLTKLEEAAVERVVTKAESAAAWRAMEAATLAQPDQEADVTP